MSLHALRKFVWSIGLVALLLGTSPPSPSLGATFVNYSAYLGGPQHSSTSAAKSITPKTARSLAKTWTFKSDGDTMVGQPPPGFYASPTVFDGRIFVGSNNGYFYAIDEGTGLANWRDFLGFQPN